MQVFDLFDKVREKKGLTSDYQLGKLLEINTNRISDYRKGKVKADNFLLTKIAIILEIDPLKVIVEIEAETEKNEVKRDFWRSFRSSWSRAAVTTTAENYSHIYNQEPQTGVDETHHKPPLWEVAEKLLNRFGGFFSSGNRERLRLTL